MPQSDGSHGDVVPENDITSSSAVTNDENRLDDSRARDQGYDLRVGPRGLRLVRAEPSRVHRSAYLELPEALAAKKAVVNVETKDQRCFLWAILSALHPQSNNSNRLAKYKPYEGEVDMTGVKWPVTVDDVALVEKNNPRLVISAFEWTADDKIRPFSIPNVIDPDRCHVQLLVVEKDGISHWCWIKNWNRLCSSKTRRFGTCPRCLVRFNKHYNFKDHLRFCRGFHVGERTDLPVIAKEQELAPLSSLLRACDRGDLDAVRKLLAAKDVDVNQTTDDGSSPLLRAAQRGHLNIALLLLDHGAYVTQAVHFQGQIGFCGAMDRLLTRARHDADLAEMKARLDAETTATKARLEADFAKRKEHLEADLGQTNDRLRAELRTTTSLLDAARTDVTAMTTLLEVDRAAAGAKAKEEAQRAATDAAKAKADAERAAAEAKAKADVDQDRLAAELGATKARRQIESVAASETRARLENELFETKSELADVRADLKRWRNGEFVSRSIIDVDTGTTTITAVECPPPPAKSARKPPPSMLSQLADATACVAEVKSEASRLQDDLEDTTLCILCYEEPRDVVFTGCGHLLSCGDCADKLLKTHGGTRKRTQAPCPACMQPIKTVLSCRLI